MITHGNLVFTSWSVSQCLDARSGYVTILFLPLAHVFARLIVYLSMRAAVTLAFAESMQTVGDDLKAIRPHFFASVPRVYEKVYDKIVSGASASGGLKAKLFHWAIDVGREAGALRLQGHPVTGLLALKHRIADKLVFKKIQAALGGRVIWTVSGAAPLNKTIGEFFHACGVLILEGLGMTENTSFSNVNRSDRCKFGTVGPVGPGVEMKVAEDGEVLFRGPNVMRGYFRNPEATAETIDADGWLFTGDVGDIDADGFLKITDRKKDQIITEGGKNIAPQRIEGILRTSQYVSQVMAYGDRRKFLVALITLDLDQVEVWATAHGVHFDDRDKLASDPRVHALVGEEIARLNQRLASFETIKKFAILDGDFTVESGELTPSLKLKRRVVSERHIDRIEELYAG
jgi:long-chain acyl-CoA synthetase